MPAAPSWRAACRKVANVGAQRTSFDKLQRERAKKAKASAKRERRLEGEREVPPEDGAAVDRAGEASAARLLEQLEQLQRRFEAEQIGYEEYEEKKTDLLSRLPVD